MKYFILTVILWFLVGSILGQRKKDSLPHTPCGYFSYFRGHCYDSVHVVELKSAGGFIVCNVSTDNIKPDKNGKYHPKYFCSYNGHDSLKIVLKHVLPKSKMYRLFIYTETCDKTCLQPKILRIDCKKPPD